MAYKVFVAGQEALAADVNTHLMSQTVSRFANAATRTAELAGPALNQLSVLNDRPGYVQYWNGSAWVDVPVPVVPPLPFPAGFHIQSANVVGTTDVYGGVAFNFAVAFNGQTVCVTNEAGGLDANTAIFALTNTQVFVNVKGPTGVPVANGLVRITYIATGIR